MSIVDDIRGISNVLSDCKLPYINKLYTFEGKMLAKFPTIYKHILEISKIVKFLDTHHALLSKLSGLADGTDDNHKHIIRMKYKDRDLLESSDLSNEEKVFITYLDYKPKMALILHDDNLASYTQHKIYHDICKFASITHYAQEKLTLLIFF
jgi:hypothetical protein